MNFTKFIQPQSYIRPQSSDITKLYTQPMMTTTPQYSTQYNDMFKILQGPPTVSPVYRQYDYRNKLPKYHIYGQDNEYYEDDEDNGYYRRRTSSKQRKARNRFKKAAKKCKRASNYRKCMSKKLRKSKRQSKKQLKARRRFKKAAKKCKKSRNYRKCMSKKLRKK